MKLSRLALILGLWMGTGISAVQAEIAVGDRYFEVIEDLGDPNGHIGSDDFQIYYFDRGEVTFRNGVVESYSIVSEEEATRQQELAAREREEQRQREQEAREERIAEGRAIRDEKISDPVFNARPASARLAFWQVFRQKYPEVDVDLLYSVAAQEARIEQAEQLAEAERERRLDELEQRMLEAEYQARLAEREAERARDYDRDNYYDRYRYDSYVYHHSRPSVVIIPDKHKHRDRDKHHHDRKPRGRSDDDRKHTENRPSPGKEDIRDRLAPDRFMFPPLEEQLRNRD
ncbi:MAG: hypothetical protein WD490_04480 [Opitutales bacterium]